MTYDVDIICVIVTEKLPFHFKRGSVNGVRSSLTSSSDYSSQHLQHVSVCVCVQAIDRGVMFEISYAAAIRDSTMRRYTIANAVNLVERSKGKVHPYDVILTSSFS